MLLVLQKVKYKLCHVVGGPDFRENGTVATEPFDCAWNKLYVAQSVIV